MTEAVTVRRVFTLLPRVLRSESIFLWLTFAGFAIVLVLLRLALLKDMDADNRIRTMMFPSIFSFLAYCILQCAAIYAADTRLGGSPVPASDALMVGFSRLNSGFRLSSLLFLIISFGSLMIIPGLLAGVVFSLAMPALVIQRVGPFASLGISRAMTRGRRFTLFWIWLIYFAASAVVVAAVALICMLAVIFVGSASVLFQYGLFTFIFDLLMGTFTMVGGTISLILFRLIEAEMPA